MNAGRQQVYHGRRYFCVDAPPSPEAPALLGVNVDMP
jgi:hypothetical protein